MTGRASSVAGVVAGVIAVVIAVVGAGCDATEFACHGTLDADGQRFVGRSYFAVGEAAARRQAADLACRQRAATFAVVVAARAACDAIAVGPACTVSWPDTLSLADRLRDLATRTPEAAPQLLQKAASQERLTALIEDSLAACVPSVDVRCSSSQRPVSLTPLLH